MAKEPKTKAPGKYMICTVGQHEVLPADVVVQYDKTRGMCAACLAKRGSELSRYWQ